MAREVWPSEGEEYPFNVEAAESSASRSDPWASSNPKEWPTTDPSTTSFATATRWGGGYGLIKRDPKNPKMWGQAISASISEEVYGGGEEEEILISPERYASVQRHEEEPKRISIEEDWSSEHQDYVPTPRIEAQYRVTAGDVDYPESYTLTASEIEDFDDYGSGEYGDESYMVQEALRDFHHNERRNRQNQAEGHWHRPYHQVVGEAGREAEYDYEQNYDEGEIGNVVGGLYSTESTRSRVPAFLAMINNRLEERGEPGLLPSTNLSPNSSRLVGKLQEWGLLAGHYDASQSNSIGFAPSNYNIPEDELRARYPDRVPEAEMEAGFQVVKNAAKQRLADRRDKARQQQAEAGMHEARYGEEVWRSKGLDRSGGSNLIPSPTVAALSWEDRVRLMSNDHGLGRTV